MAQCPNCGAQASAKFCPNCGAQIPQAPPLAASAIPPQPTPPPGYYPNPYQQMPPQKSGGSPLKIIGIVAGALVGLLALVIVVLVALAPDSVGAPVITSQVDPKTQEPLEELKTVPSATDAIYAAAEVSAEQGRVVTAKWYYEGRLQEQLNYDLEMEEDYEGWVSFQITNGGEPWPPGQYRVELYLDGELEQTADFSVN